MPYVSGSSIRPSPFAEGEGWGTRRLTRVSFRYGHPRCSVNLELLQATIVGDTARHREHSMASAPWRMIRKSVDARRVVLV